MESTSELSSSSSITTRRRLRVLSGVATGWTSVLESLALLAELEAPDSESEF